MGFIMEKILANIGAILGYSVLGIGAVSTATYALFKIFSEKWLTAKFDERLASYKHQEAQETRLGGSIDGVGGSETGAKQGQDQNGAQPVD